MNIYFDMDGVLAKYDRDAYVGELPRFRQPGAHYFRDLPPDERAVEALRILEETNEERDGLFVLSSLTNTGSIFLEQYRDKTLWLEDQFGAVARRPMLVPSVTNKRDVAEFLMHRRLTVNDVLIDDYNPNLEDWRDHGGMAVKYLNGINSADSFSGPIIDLSMSARNIVEMLEALRYAQ